MEIAWVMVAAGRVLQELVGVAELPLLTLSEPQSGYLRVPWLVRVRSDVPAFALGVQGLEEQATHILLREDRDWAIGDPAYRLPHLDEGGFRQGLVAVVRSAGSHLGYALAGAAAIALALQTDGLVADAREAWVPAAGGETSHDPEDVRRALAAPSRGRSVLDGATALWHRSPPGRAAHAS